jgi:HEAT repeat protein
MALLEFALAIPGIAQVEAKPGPEPARILFADTGPTPTAAELLTQRHISLTKDALLQALHSEDAETRGLAAAQLEEEGAKDTIPEIAETLEAEQEPLARVNLASILAHMGYRRGIQALQQDCDDSGMPIVHRLQAAQDLLDMREKSCPWLLVEALQNIEAGGRVVALSMISNFKDLSPNQSAQLRALLLQSLSDQDLAVKIQASFAVRTLGDVSAIPALESAISKESDSVVRAAMERDLKALQGTKE